MFIGEYQHNIDLKGRLAIPARFRRNLKSGAVVTRGLDNCLFLYTADEWKRLAQKLVTLPLSQAKSRAFTRLMLSGAHEVKVDSQGRINVPDHLITFGRLKKHVVVAGLYNRVELWDALIWKRYKIRAEKESDKIAESLGELGV